MQTCLHLHVHGSVYSVIGNIQALSALLCTFKAAKEEVVSVERTRSIRGLPEKLLHLEDLLLVINGIIHSKVLVGQGRVGSNSGRGRVGSGRGRGRVVLGRVEVWSGRGRVRPRSGWVEAGPWSGRVGSRSSRCRVRSRSGWVEVLGQIEGSCKAVPVHGVSCH